MSFVSSKGNILCRLINIELYKIFAIINRAIKGLHCILSVVFFNIALFIRNDEWQALFAVVNTNGTSP